MASSPTHQRWSSDRFCCVGAYPKGCVNRVGRPFLIFQTNNMKKFALGLLTGILLIIPVLTLSAPNFAEKLKGKILLAVEDKGKTYYVANDGYRYRITVDTAQKVFEKLAVGITNNDLSKITEKELGISSEAVSNSEKVSISPKPSNITQYILTYVAGLNGVVIGTSPQTIVKGSNGVSVVATPNSGYHFVNWSDGSVTNPRIDININSNISVTANFVTNNFSCGQSFFDSRDSNSYPTVQIGAQCWMAKNLAYLPFVDIDSTKGEVKPHYYVYGHNNTNLSLAKVHMNYITYGVLYNYPAAMTACPSGWHLPSNSEWTTLVNFAGGKLVAGDKLKATPTSSPVSWNGTNDFGFTAIPDNVHGFSAIYRSSTVGKYSEYGDFHWYISTEDTSFSSLDLTDKEKGVTVRCLRD